MKPPDCPLCDDRGFIYLDMPEPGSGSHALTTTCICRKPEEASPPTPDGTRAELGYAS